MPAPGTEGELPVEDIKEDITESMDDHCVVNDNIVVNPKKGSAKMLCINIVNKK